MFAGSVADAEQVLRLLVAFDADDPFSRELSPGALAEQPLRRLGIPRELEGTSDEYQRLFAEAVENARSLGIECVPVDVEPFLEAALLLVLRVPPCRVRRHDRAGMSRAFEGSSTNV